MGELAFPGIVMLLKLVTKLFVGRSATPFDFLKVMVVFPIDVTFLALSFGAALLYVTPPSDIQVGTLKAMFVFFAACIILSIITTAICQKSDKFLDEWNVVRSFLYSIVTYGVSFGALITSVNVPELIR